MCDKDLAVGTLFCMSWKSFNMLCTTLYDIKKTDKVLLMYIGEDKVVLLGEDYAKVLHIPSFVYQLNTVKYVSSSPSETGITSLNPKFLDFLCDMDEEFYDDYDETDEDDNYGTAEDGDDDDDTGYEEESTGDNGSADSGYYVIDSDWDVLTKEFKSFEEAKEWITHSLYDISDLSVAKKYK